VTVPTGERRVVSVLVADVVGSTAIAERHRSSQSSWGQISAGVAICELRCEASRGPTCGPNVDLTIGLTMRNRGDHGVQDPAHEAARIGSSMSVATPDSACHAGGRGFESRRSRRKPCKAASSVAGAGATTAGLPIDLALIPYARPLSGKALEMGADDAHSRFLHLAGRYSLESRGGAARVRPQRDEYVAPARAATYARFVES
jgi:hypothetical protein